jgi:hypothetical protein
VLADQTDEDWVWQTTHVGGDRFAGNVVVLPEGLYYGRVHPEEAWALLDEHIARRVYLERFRGRSTQPFAVQAAEIALRGREDIKGIDDVRVERAESQGDRWKIRLRGPERTYDVELRVEAGELTYLTCKADTLRHPPRYVVESPPEPVV